MLYIADIFKSVIVEHEEEYSGFKDLFTRYYIAKDSDFQDDIVTLIFNYKAHRKFLLASKGI